MTDNDLVTRTRPATLEDLIARVRAGRLGVDPASVTVAIAFLTLQSNALQTSQYVNRDGRHHNAVLSLRVGAAVGSCAFDPAVRADHSAAVNDCVGATIAELLAHPLHAVRVAALDAYLMHTHPHPDAGGVRSVPTLVAGESTLAKSRDRAAGVIDLLPESTRSVLVIGVLNLLLAELRKRGIRYIPCDLMGGHTEWGERVHTTIADVSEPYDSLLVTGMCLANDSFDALLEHARGHRLPMVMYAQTGSAILPWFLGVAGVCAVAAEPYPFFWLDGGPSTHFHYRSGEVA